jgi:aminomethyltransferase
VTLTNRSDETALIAIQGPKAEAVMGQLVNFDLAKLDYYSAAEGNVGSQKIVFGRTGYTGEDGFEVYVPNELAADCWDAAVEVGAEHGAVPIGLGARDTLRLEMKFALYGNDIDETTNPIEAGLGWVVKPDKGIEFIGRDKVVAMKEAGPQRRLVAFAMDGKGIPRPGCEIRVDGEPVGKVTSGTQSPSLNQGIGLGYINAPHHKVGSKIQIDVRGQDIPASVIKPPFVKTTSHK